MRSRGMRRLGVVGGIAGVLFAAGVTPAQAVTPDGTADVGSVSTSRGGHEDAANSLAACVVDGTEQGSTRGRTVTGVVRYGVGSTKCVRNDDANTVHVEARGSRFQLDAFTPSGGPRIRMTSYQASCDATDQGTSVTMSINGLTGITSPATIPANHTTMIPGRHAGDPPRGKVILNEVVRPDPNDGGLTLNVMHVVLYAQGGSDISGDVYAGSVACAPTF